MKHLHISEDELYLAYKLFFNTFASEQRLRILNLLKKKPMNVSELQEATGQEQTEASHNLQRLKTCGFVYSEMQGKYRKYHLDRETAIPILNIIDKHMQKHCLRIIQHRTKGGHQNGIQPLKNNNPAIFSGS